MSAAPSIESEATAADARAPDAELDRLRRDRLGLLTEGETAQALGVGERTLVDMRKAGAGPDHVTIGRSVLYRVEAIRDWLERREQPSTARSRTP